MKKQLLILGISILSFATAMAQNVGINADGSTPDASAMLDVKDTKTGILIPRVDISDLTTAVPVSSPLTSLLVYNTNTTTGPGYFYWDGSKWVKLFDINDGEYWKLTGNTGTTAGTNFIGTTDAVDFVVKTSNIERMRVLSGGNVGIGTSSPTYPVQIYSSGSTWPLRIQNASGYIDIGPNNASWAHIYTDRPNFIFNKSVYTIGNEFSSYSTGNLYLQTGGTTRITALNSNGFVGIGTTAPSNMLQMINTGAVGANVMASFDNNGSDGVSLSGSNNGTSNGYNAIEGVTYGQYSGVFGLGISQDNGTAYDAYGVYGHANDEQGYGVYGVRVLAGGANSGFGGLFINDLGYTGWFGSVSDRKLKKDVSPISNAIETVMLLKPVQYYFNINKYPYLGLNTLLEYGFIAQDIEQTLPDIVKEKTLDINAAKHKTSNSPLSKQNENFKMVNYIEIIPILTKAIQEQQKIIEDFKKRIERLEKLKQKY